MSTNQDAVSPLRRRMIEDMTIRHLTAKTQGVYIRHVRPSRFSCAGRPIWPSPRICVASSCTWRPRAPRPAR